jgi:hypothetical protein
LRLQKFVHQENFGIQLLQLAHHVLKIAFFVKLWINVFFAFQEEYSLNKAVQSLVSVLKELGNETASVNLVPLINVLLVRQM